PAAPPAMPLAAAPHAGAGGALPPEPAPARPPARSARRTRGIPCWPPAGHARAPPVPPGAPHIRHADQRFRCAPYSPPAGLLGDGLTEPPHTHPAAFEQPRR